MYKVIVVLLVVSLFAMGCSHGATGISLPDPVSPAGELPGRTHSTWGLWQGIIDPETETIDFIQLRGADFHLNALPFLEPPPLVNLTLESLQFNGNIIETDIGLRHPFLGLTEFTGFDVCGIFITNGSVGGYNDPALRMAGEGDTRLLNPDGYARWWNPMEFPFDGTIFGYKDGLLGTPYSSAGYNCTLNGYKYFCDDLEPNDDLDGISVENRGMFSAGQKNIRHYTIELGNGLIFNYAVDACWVFPEGPAPWDAPDDFVPDANRAEPYRISVGEVENKLYNNGSILGGDLLLDIDVYDWFNAEMNTIRVESPGNFPMVESTTIIGGGVGYSTYEVEINDATPAPDEIELLISIVSEDTDFGGFISGTNTTAYFMHTSPVSVEEPIAYKVVLDAGHYFDSVLYDYAPSVIVDPAGQVYVTYSRYYNTIPNSTSDYSYSADSGASWIEPYYGTYGTTASYPMITYPAISTDGVVYHLINGPNYGIWSLIVRFDNQGGNCGIYVSRIAHGNSFIFTYDGFPIGFGDYGGYINAKKGNIPNSPYYNGPEGPSWDWNQLDYGNTIVPSPARLSHTRNIERDSSNSLHLAYFSSNSNGTWARMAVNSDGDGVTWDIDNDIYDGVSDGYDVVRDPGIRLDSNGIWHCAFIRHTYDPQSTESIAYCRSTNGVDWEAPYTAYELPDIDILDDPTVETVDIEGQEIIVVTYLEGDKVYLIFSWDEGETWQPPTLLSTGTDKLPDTCASTDGYVHNVWEHDNNAGDKRVEYVRAHFEED